MFNKQEAFNTFKDKQAADLVDPNDKEALQSAWNTLSNYAKTQGPQALKYLNKGWDFLKNQGKGVVNDVSQVAKSPFVSPQNPAESKRAFDQFVQATSDIQRYSEFSKISSDFLSKYYELAKKLQSEGKRHREIEVALAKFVKPGQVFINDESTSLLDNLAESHNVVEEIIEEMKKEVERAFDQLSNTQTSKNLNQQQLRSLGPGGF